MVVEVTGYTWNNEQAARNANNAAKVHFGVPVDQEAITTEWIEPIHNVGSEGDFWYWIGDLSTVFGTPETFNINIDEE
jgi:hypothetical protein